MQFESWLAFCAIALLATATPGPAALLVSVNSLSNGFKKSLATVFGNIVGLFIMSGMSVLGLSALVLHSAVGFTIVKVLGALYLIYIGITLWKSGVTPLDADKVQTPKPCRQLFIQGLLVALGNPKAIVFTTSLFPQFISVSEPLLPQFSILVASFMSLSFICLSTYSFLAQMAKVRSKKMSSGRWLGKLMGSTFIGAGCYLATVSK